MPCVEHAYRHQLLAGAKVSANSKQGKGHRGYNGRSKKKAIIGCGIAGGLAGAATPHVDFNTKYFAKSLASSICVPHTLVPRKTPTITKQQQGNLNALLQRSRLKPNVLWLIRSFLPRMTIMREPKHRQSKQPMISIPIRIHSTSDASAYHPTTNRRTWSARRALPHLSAIERQ